MKIYYHVFQYHTTKANIYYFLCLYSAIIEIAWFDVMFASTLADVMTLVLEQLVKNIDKIFENDVNTDLILCSTTSWVQTLDESKLVFQKPELHSKTVLTKVSSSAT